MTPRPTLSGAKFSILIVLLTCAIFVGISIYIVGYALGTGQTLYSLILSHQFVFVLILLILISAGLLQAIMLGRFAAHRSFPTADKIFDALRWAFCVALLIAGVLTFHSIILPGYGSAIAISTFDLALAVWICPIKIGTAARQAFNLAALTVSFTILLLTLNLLAAVAVLVNFILLDVFTYHWDPFLKSFE